MKARLRLILSADEFMRLTITDLDGIGIHVIADVHGMKCSEVRRLIINTIAIVHTSFHLTIIHGYRHGTAIKQMLANGFDNSHIKEKYLDPRNKGITHIAIAG